MLINNLGSEFKQINKYCDYFLAPENDRKIKYVEILRKLAQDRQSFLKNPGSFEFNRNESEISALDSIEKKQANMLYNSLKLERKPTLLKSGLNKSKLWKSDLHKM